MKSPITPNFYPKFFSAMRDATSALGLNTKDEQNAYYKRVLDETAHCASIKHLPSLAAYDACLARFATDARNYTAAIDPDVEQQKRRAYVAKVMCYQIMQLKAVDDRNARAYFNGLLRQSRPSSGVLSRGEGFYLDLSAGSLLLALRILDSYLRKLKKQYFPSHPMTFNDRVRYVKTGSVYILETVEKWYYHNLPFKVLF